MIRALTLLAISTTALSAQLAANKPTVDFNSKIKPIFSRHCYDCHNDKKDKGGFAFDKLERMATNIGRGRIIVPGNIEESDLIDIVQGTNGKKKMPPEDKGELSAREITLLRDWIKEGAIVPGLPRDPAQTASVSPTTKESKMMTWTNHKGESKRAVFEGRFKDAKNDFVKLRFEDGKVVDYPMNQLSRESQTQAKIQELRQ